MAAYPNRSDLRTAIPKQAATGQPYGEAGKQLAAQEAIPMGAPPAPPPPEPGARGPFTRPTERPDEPVTAGMPVGPGAGPSVNPAFPMAPPAPGSPQAIVEILRAIAAQAPNANFLAVIAEVEKQAGSGRRMIAGPPPVGNALSNIARRASGRQPGGAAGAAIERAAAGAVGQAVATYGEDVGRGA